MVAFRDSRAFLVILGGTGAAAVEIPYRTFSLLAQRSAGGHFRLHPLLTCSFIRQKCIGGPIFPGLEKNQPDAHLLFSWALRR